MYTNYPWDVSPLFGDSDLSNNIGVPALTVTHGGENDLKM